MLGAACFFGRAIRSGVDHVVAFIAVFYLLLGCLDSIETGAGVGTCLKDILEGFLQFGGESLVHVLVDAPDLGVLILVIVGFAVDSRPFGLRSYAHCRLRQDQRQSGEGRV